MKSAKSRERQDVREGTLRHPRGKGRTSIVHKGQIRRKVHRYRCRVCGSWPEDAILRGLSAK